MKKILSALLAVIMILSVMSVSAFVVSATPATHTLDAKNVGIDVPYFSGTTVFYEIGGKTTDDVKTVDEWGTINHADKKGEGVLNLDGTITEEEWGNPIISLRSDKAATIGGKTPSAENTFYWLKKKGTAAANNAAAGTNAGAKYVISNNGMFVNLRAGAGNGYGIIKQIKDGTTVTMVNMGPQWSQILADGSTGFVMTNFLKKK